MKKKRISPYCKCPKTTSSNGKCMHCGKPIWGHSAEMQKKYGYPLSRNWHKESFDNLVYNILSEQLWEYDTKKVFYVIDEIGFEERLGSYVEADPTPLLNGQLPAKKPMFQTGAFAGKMADSTFWASNILEYFETHGSPLKPKEILRNAQVKPNDTALFNFYKDVKEHLGTFVEYKLFDKSHKASEEDEEEIEVEPEEPKRWGPIAGKLAMGLLSSLAPVRRR